MTVAKFAETLLLRDFLSYLAPGALILLMLTDAGLDGGFTQRIADLSTYWDRGWVAVLTIGTLCYIVGYLASTALFYVRGWIKPLRRPAPEIHQAARDKAATIFGAWIAAEAPEKIVALCLHYVEVLKPDHYFEKIERRVVLRNFEVSLAAVFLVFALTLALAMSGWHRFTALVPVLLAILLLVSRRNLDAAIDRVGMTAFLAVSNAPVQKEKT